MSKPYSPSWVAAMTACCVAAVVAIVCQPAEAKDKWGDENVKYHFVGEAGLGLFAGLAIDDPYVAFGVAIVPGLYREQWKRNHGYSSYQPSRIAADFAGAALGVSFGHYLKGLRVTPHSIVYQTEF